MKKTRPVAVCGAWICAVFVATLGLAACSGGGGGTGDTQGSQDADAGTVADTAGGVDVQFDTGGPGDAAGAGDADAGSGGQDTAGPGPGTDADDATAADGIIAGDAPPVDDTGGEPDSEVGEEVECEEDVECEDVLAAQIVQCTRAACVANECVVLPILQCCQSVTECEGVLNLDDCEQAACVDQQCVKTGIPNCCEVNADCEQLADGCCTEAYCGIDNKCVLEAKDACCAVDSDCDDGSETTIDVCSEACVHDGCINQWGGECESQSQPVAKSFDDGTLQLLQTVDTNSGDSVGVQVSKVRRVSGKYSVYFGDPDCETYYNGPVGQGCALPPFSTPANTTGVNLELRVPQFSLDDDKGFYLGFWVNMAAEPAVSVPFPDGIQVLDVDWLQVVVDYGFGSDIVWKSTDPDALGEANTTEGQWRYQVANLAPYSGQAVTVMFNFVTDNASNFNESPGGEPWYGVYLDDIVVTSTCAENACGGSSDTCSDDLDTCTDDACTGFAIGGGGVCGYQTSTPGSLCVGCQEASDCGNEPECFDYACNAGVCDVTQKPECCSPASTFPEVTAPGEVALEGFEDGNLAGWQVVDEIDDNVGWQVTTILTYNGTHSLYFGDPTKQTYAAEPPNPAKATAWTPVFEVPAEDFKKGVASFWLWMSTEFDGAVVPPDPAQGFDQLTLWVKGTSPSAVPTEVWNSAEGVLGSTGGEWRQIGVDLSEWAGKDVRLGFEFDSGDAEGVSTANSFGGVRIDDLTVTSFCDTECLSFSDCLDEDFCTLEHCDFGECVSIQEDPNCCFEDADCDDDNECSVDECTEEGCLHYYDDSSETKLNCCASNGAPWLGGWVATFEDGTLGQWQGQDETAPTVWYAAGDAGADGSLWSANFGDPATGTFDNGELAAYGLLISPPVDVPPLTKGTPYAEFDLLLSTEWDDGDPNEFFPQFVVDDLTVSVAVDGYLAGAVEMWESHYLFNTTQGKWIRTRLDLSEYRDQSVQLVFEFDSGDDNKNDYAGPLIDNVGFATTCLPDNAIQCLYGGDCVPSDDCKVAACSEDFKCVESPKPTPECCEPFVEADLTMDFEGDPEGWTNTPCESGGSQDDPESVWQFTGAAAGGFIQPKVGDGMLYMGNGTSLAAPEFGACDQMTSACIDLAEEVPWSAGMWVYADIEKTPDCQNGGAPFSDQLVIYVQDCAGEVEDELVWTKFDLECNEYDKWVYVEFDLDAWAGKSVRLHFSMDTWDSVKNDGKGVGVDQVEFTKGCAAVP